MQKSRDVFSAMTQKAGMSSCGPQNSHAGQQNREVSRQELLSPKWRGPFEGYR